MTGAISLFVDTAPDTQLESTSWAQSFAKDANTAGIARAKSLSEPFMALAHDVADAFAVTTADVFGGGRFKNVASARHVIAWIARDRWEFSFPLLGRLLGRDHSTIMNSCKRVEEEIRKQSKMGQIAIRMRGRGRLELVAGQGVVIDAEGELVIELETEGTTP